MHKAIVFRADSSARFGMGHVMRCIALAQAFKEQGVDPIFVSKSMTRCGMDKIKEEEFSLVMISPDLNSREDARATIQAVRSCGATQIVVDINHAGTLAYVPDFIEFLEVLKEDGLCVTVIEGMGEECISAGKILAADIIVVPYLGARDFHYKTQPETKVLAGEQYFPFRKDFVKYSGEAKKINPIAKRILVSMGGGDVGVFNEKVLRAIFILGYPGIEVKITGQVSSDILSNGCCPVQVIAHSNNMPELIAWADIAVISSGLTRYETALLGTPAIGISLNGIHARIMDEFAKQGTMQHLGVFDHVSVGDIADALRQMSSGTSERVLMSKRGKGLLDGQGSERLVVEILKECAV